MCNCRSEDPWECESLRWGQPGDVKDTACMCGCHENETPDDDGPTPDDRPVPGCDCHDCIR